jgi:hypothetical protein
MSRSMSTFRPISTRIVCSLSSGTKRNYQDLTGKLLEDTSAEDGDDPIS